MFLKEDFIPAKADKWLFIIGPGISMFTALITSSVIPWGTIQLNRNFKDLHHYFDGVVNLSNITHQGGWSAINTMECRLVGKTNLNNFKII
jgi:NADH:ubiquinone oxidoreductase subunit H